MGSFQTSANPHTRPPHQKNVPQEAPEIQKWGPTLEANFRNINFFLASDPPELCAIARVHKRQAAQRAERKIGPSVAYKTTGTVLSQRMRHEDASGQATDK